MDKVQPRRRKRTLALADSYDLSKYRIGPVRLDIYIFDRDPRVLQLGVTDRKGLREFLDEAGGIRVYRDGIRVYDYGEPGNDWLRLGGRRINVPTQRISNNLVIGAVALDLAESRDLVEKTNREGFVENDAYLAFRDAVSMAIVQVEAERNVDKSRIRETYGGRTKEPVLDTLFELRRLVERRKLKEIEPYLDRIEEDFNVIRDRFLVSAAAGLSLSTVIHEVEKGIDELRRAVEAEHASPRVRELARHLAELTEGFAALARKSGISSEKANVLISQALFNTELRMKAHHIVVERRAEEDKIEVECSRRLIISTLMNLIDNSIYWLDNRWNGAKDKKRIYIAVSRELSAGPAIIVADNGPGFLDPPEYLVQPFFTRKPDGMGLGLHLADQVMKAQGSRLVFPQRGDVVLPEGFDGAVVALAFSKAAT
jgi:signal transduction histidine kinase